MGLPLADGRGARLGGVDKGWVPFDGQSLVRHVFAAGRFVADLRQPEHRLLSGARGRRHRRGCRTRARTLSGAARQRGRRLHTRDHRLARALATFLLNARLLNLALQPFPHLHAAGTVIESGCRPIYRTDWSHQTRRPDSLHTDSAGHLGLVCARPGSIRVAQQDGFLGSTYPASCESLSARQAGKALSPGAALQALIAFVAARAAAFS